MKTKLKFVIKKAKYFIAWVVLEGCSLIIKALPQNYVYALAKFIAGVGYLLSRKQVGVAFEGLNMVFGRERKPAEIKRIARDSFEAMAKSALELVYLLGKSDRVIKQTFSFEHKHYLEQALSYGRGVILVTAHMGNFVDMLARLSVEGYKTAVIMRPLKYKRLERIFIRDRERFKIRTVETIPRSKCVANALRSLRNNEALLIPLDQNFGTGGVFVDFLGKKAATATGPVIFAQRTGALIVPCFVIRQKDNTNKIFFEPPMELELGKDDHDTIVINIQRITAIIEKYVRKYPQEWSWIHRRWKAQMR